MLVLPTLFGLLAAFPQVPDYPDWIPLDAPPSEVPYGVEHWGVRAGLPQIQVNALAVDEAGLMYVGTHAGLATFDGARFEPLGELDGRDLRTMRILALRYDNRGQLWIGTQENGVAILAKENSRWLDFPAGVEMVDGVREIAVSPAGEVWVGCDQGAFVFTADGLPVDHHPLGWVHDIDFHPDGSVLLAGEKLWQLRGASVEVLYGSPLTSVLVSSEAVIWAGDRHTRILRLEEDRTWTGWKYLNEGGIDEILETEDGTLWFSSWNPIEFRDGSFYRALSEGRRRLDVGLGTDAMLRDREGTIWLGGGGLTALRERPLWAVQIEGFRGDTPRIVLEDRLAPGTVWVGQYSGKLGRFNLLGDYEVWEGLSIDSLATGPDSATYAASKYHGLVRLTAEETREILPPHALLEGPALALLPDENNSWWISAGSALQYFDADTNRRSWDASRGLDLGEIHILNKDPQGLTWVGAKHGAAVIENGKVAAVFRSGEQIAPGAVRAIYIEPDGRVWLGHYGGGLSAQQRDGSWRRISSEHGLHDNTVHTILGDSSGGMTLLGNLGITRLDPDDLRGFEAGVTQRLTPRVFDQAPGAQVFEGMGGAMPAGSRLASGNVIFAAFQELVLFRTDIAASKLPPPIVLLRPMMVDSVRYDLSEEHQFDGDFRAVALRYHATSATDRHLLRYQRQLVGHDEDWIDVGNTEIAHYSNLRPGTYRFRVRAANRDGVWSEVVESAPFTFTPRLIETAWFQRTLFLGALGFISLIVFLRFRAQRQRSEALAKLVEERTADLQAARDHLESEVSSRTQDLQQALDQLKNDLGERERLRDQLRRAERLEALGLVTNGVAHEFNNLLTVVLGEAEVGRAATQDEELRQRMDRILSAGHQAAELTDEMLRFSRSIPSDESEVYFDTEVRRAADLTISLMPHGVRAVQDYAAERARVRINPSQLGVIVMNLVLNARDASPRGSEIRILTGSDDQKVRLIVEDNGEGIPAENLDRIFEPFFSTKAPGVGSGFGLASVKRSVERAGGTISVETEAGQGTRFTVELPRCGVSPEDRPAVLICDDEPGVLEVIQGVLADEPMQVLAARSPREAIAIARDLKGELDILITDSVMPGMNGDELLAAIRELSPQVRAGFISGYSRTGLQASGASESEAPFLGKPFRPEELLAFVDELLSPSTEPAAPDSP